MEGRFWINLVNICQWINKQYTQPLRHYIIFRIIKIHLVNPTVQLFFIKLYS